ncbi:TIGR02391 family protein [Streptomyces bungoensis]|uniref:TIGR02391 family protein n=1 Tax=Streptomyces bungoensis TaxID=285568 RepID=UPI00343EE8EF
MREAFRPHENGKAGGALADAEAEGGEQTVNSGLFARAMGAYKNPASHSTVDFDDPIEAAEIIQFADLLLRQVERAKRRQGAATILTRKPSLVRRARPGQCGDLDGSVQATVVCGRTAGGYWSGWTAWMPVSAYALGVRVRRYRPVGWGGVGGWGRGGRRGRRPRSARTGAVRWRWPRHRCQRLRSG